MSYDANPAVPDHEQGEPLFLVAIPLRLGELSRFAQARNLGLVKRRRRSDGRERTSDVDEGRALHHLLGETFGPGTLRPFRLLVSPGKAGACVYAYSRLDGERLLTTAHETALPDVAGPLELERLAAKAMPGAREWRPGRRLSFDIRIRPVVRLMNDLPHPRQPNKPYRRGSELDAFVVEAGRRFANERPRILDGVRQPGGMEREQRQRQIVYCDWLASRLAPGARLDTERTRLAHFRRTRVARTANAPEGPDAILHGELEITEPGAFCDLLANGVGRHKAYGYGMLLLRPAATPSTRTRQG